MTETVMREMSRDVSYAIRCPGKSRTTLDFGNDMADAMKRRDKANRTNVLGRNDWIVARVTTVVEEVI